MIEKSYCRGCQMTIYVQPVIITTYSASFNRVLRQIIVVNVSGHPILIFQCISQWALEKAKA